MRNIYSDLETRLLADNRRLQTEIEQLRAMLAPMAAELAQVRAENERLRAALLNAVPRDAG